MILIIDDSVPESFANEYEELVKSVNFPWYFARRTVEEKDSDYQKDKNELVVPFMFHTVINDGKINSTHWELASKLLENVERTGKVKIKEIANVRLNLQFANGKEGYHNGMHTDGWSDMNITALYYVDDSDGDTHFFNTDGTLMQTVSPKKGRWVFFDNNQLHASSCPSVNKERVVVNWNMLGEYEV